MKRDAPVVNVYVGKDTFVHIRQLVYDTSDDPPRESRDGVKMSLMQFRSLMFHLRALDAKFTPDVDENEEKVALAMIKENDQHDGVRDGQQIEHDVTHVGLDDAEDANQRDEREENLASEPIAKGQKRAWNDAFVDSWVETVEPYEPAGDVLDEEVSYVPTTPQHAPSKNALNSLAEMMDMFEPTSVKTVVKQKEAECLPSVTEQSPSTKALSLRKATAGVRDELAILYAEELVSALPQLVPTCCLGCMLGLDRSTSPTVHDVCTLPRKERIERFAEEFMGTVDELSVRDKLIKRMDSRYVPYDNDTMYVTKQALCSNKTWMHKMKKRAWEM